MTVTDDPDVAREDDAVLLAAGHPVLTCAAELVLADGEAGVMALPAPASATPQRDELLAKAREQFPVQHGRIDVTDAPRPGVRPVLRVGALVSYAISEEDPFQSGQKCWVDVLSRLELPVTISDRLVRLEPTELDGLQPEYDLAPATAEAHRLIEIAAVRRQDSVSTQVSGAFERQRERTNTYYTEQLASLERRRSTAAPDQQAMLDARSEAIPGADPAQQRQIVRARLHHRAASQSRRETRPPLVGDARIRQPPHRQVVRAGLTGRRDDPALRTGRGKPSDRTADR